MVDRHSRLYHNRDSISLLQKKLEITGRALDSLAILYMFQLLHDPASLSLADTVSIEGRAQRPKEKETLDGSFWLQLEVAVLDYFAQPIQNASRYAISGLSVLIAS